MSRAKPAAERVAGDAYNTPATLAEAICSSLPGEPSFIVEPSAGQGAFVRAIRARWPKAYLRAVEIHPDNAQALYAAGADGVYASDWCAHARLDFGCESRPPDLIIGNPPYREAERHIDAAMNWLSAGGRLAFLLRLNFLGSTARVPMWQRPGLFSVQTVSPRPSFTGGGTDGTEYAVFVWMKGYTGPAALLPPLVWRERNARRTA